MGCTGSDTINTAVRSPAADGTSQSDKQSVIKFIKNDNILELTMLLEEKGIPLNAQISDAGMKWMMIHYCCRYDADNCLEYLLKNYFVERGSGYIDFVNAPTVEGYTPLHLCAMWKGEKAFTVLYYYGGLNLGSCDKSNKTALDMAFQYQSRDMSKILSNFKELKIYFTIVQTQRLTSGKVICEDPLEERKKKQVNIDEINKKLQLQNKIQDTPEQKQLKQDKKKLETEAQQVLQMKIKKQAELKAQKDKIAATKDMKLAQKQQYEKQMQAKLDQKLKQERDKFKEQMDNKDRELARLKQELKRVKAQKIADQRQRVKNQTENYVKQNEAMMQDKMKARNQAVNRMKQNNPQNVNPNQNKNQKMVEAAAKPQKPLEQKKNIRSPLAEAFGERKQKLPPQIQRLYAQAQKNGVFVDHQFQAVESSIGDKSNENFANSISKIVWLRPAQIFGDEQYQLFNGIQSSDVQQGQLGVCYMLATISSLATNPKYIQDMFVFSDIELGFYVIKLYIHGKPKLFTIDDQIPCDKSSNYPCFTQPVGNELWVMLMEKVWAKAIGSYMSAEGMVPDQMMEDLSGAPGFGGFFQNDADEENMTIEEHMQILVEHCQAGSSIVLSSKQTQVKGIVSGHAYSLLECFDNKGSRIFKIRNPWGNFQWQGEYSQKSRKLTAAVKQLIGYTNEDDGVFFMSEAQLLKVFNYYSISVLAENHIYSYKEFTSKRQQDKFFKFNITKKDYINIRIIQRFNRMLNDPEYQYSPGTLEIGKIEKDGSVTYMGQGDKDTYFGAKSIHALESVGQEFQPGTYFVRLRMLWVNQNKYNTAVLAAYAGEPVQFEQLDPKKGVEYLKKLFYSHAQDAEQNQAEDGVGTYKIVTMKGQFVMIAQTDNKANYSVDFEFTESQLDGVRLQLGKATNTKLTVNVTKNQPGIGTVAILSPQDGGNTGELYVTFNKK